jgi:hypothetical protein
LVVVAIAISLPDFIRITESSGLFDDLAPLTDGFEIEGNQLMVPFGQGLLQTPLYIGQVDHRLDL